MTTQHKLLVQLISCSLKKHGEGRVVFACDHEAFVKLDILKTMDTGIIFWLEKAAGEKIQGQICSLSSTSSPTNPRKLVLETPETEKVKVAELSTLVGMELELNIDLAAQPLPLAD